MDIVRRHKNMYELDNVTPEMIKKHKSRGNSSYDLNSKFVKNAKTLLRQKLYKNVVPKIENYLKNGEKVIISASIPEYLNIDYPEQRGNFLPVSYDEEYFKMPAVVIKILNKNGEDIAYINFSNKKNGKDMYIDSSSNWNNKLFGKDVNQLNNIIKNEIIKSVKEYAKEIIHNKDGRDLRINSRGEKENLRYPSRNAKDKLAFEDVNYFPY